MALRIEYTKQQVVHKYIFAASYAINKVSQTECV